MTNHEKTGKNDTVIFKVGGSIFFVKHDQFYLTFNNTNGKCNICGAKIKELRESSNLSQEQLAAKLQLNGLNITQKAISRIESGERVVPDYELTYFAKIFNVTVAKLLDATK